MKKLALLIVFVQSLVFANNPVITLNGDSVVELYLNSYYDDPGATAFDAEDGDLSNSIVVTGTYDSSTMGSYVLAYSVTDSDGNQSVEIRTINVVDEINESYQGTLEYQIYDSNQSGELDSGDDISFKLTSKNTGNVGGDGGQYDYTFLDFNANSILLTSNSFVGGIQLDVGDTNVSYSTYTITEQTLNSGGVELEVNLFFGGYYFKSNKLIVTFETGSSEEIILNGQISANNNQIKKVADPTDNLDAVNKRYVDQRTLEQTIPGQNIGDLLYWNGQSWQKLSAPQEQSTLRFCEGQLTWGPCKSELYLIKESDGANDLYFTINTELRGSVPTQTGVLISSSNTTPNFDDTIINSTNDSNEFHFSVDDQIWVSNLELNTTYYIRAFAQHIDGLGTSFSKTLTFKTLSEDQNGNTIYSKTYGDQEWATQNANVSTYRDGTPIPEVDNNDHSTFYYATTGVYMQTDYGKFYNWYAIMGIHDNDLSTPNKQFAPEGWHVPSRSEWETLRDYLIANGYNYDGTTTGNKIAKAMASALDWYEYDSSGAVGTNQGSNNSSWFNAFPYGVVSGDAVHNSVGQNASFWTTTYTTTNYATIFNLSYISPSLNMITVSLFGRGHSVRFVKD